MDYAHLWGLFLEYTGILLSAFNARLYGIHQYWDPLFLSSGLSAGAAAH